MPDRAPDGRRLVFQSNRSDSGFDIYSSNVDGCGETALAASAGRELDPAWSSDGQFILFDSDRDHILQQIRQVYVMNADGTGQCAPTGLPSENGHPAWGRGKAKD